MITLRILVWAGNVAGIGEGEVLTGFCCVNLREKDQIEDTCIDGKII
jgi:hypothetical protein